MSTGGILSSSSASSTSSSYGSSTSSAIHQPEPAYHPMTASQPVTVTSADGTVQHPGQQVRHGVESIGTTVNHALASVTKGVGDALGLHHDTPAVVVSNHNPNNTGQRSACNTQQQTATRRAAHCSAHSLLSSQSSTGSAIDATDSLMH